MNYSEVKGIWISYIELAALLQGQSKEGFRSNIAAVYENCADLGINTVYVHVRSHSDAYYRSELFPLSSYFLSINSRTDFSMVMRRLSSGKLLIISAMNVVFPEPVAPAYT